MLSRRAVTLAELLVALALAALVLATATTSVLRQQRTHARINSVASTDAQLRAATLVLTGQLALLDARAGDLVQGEAADTALQFRAPVASSLACRQEVGAATLLPESGAAVALGGSASPARTGDTLWWLADSGWAAGLTASVARVGASCTAPVAVAGAALRVVLTRADTIPAGAPLRVTRQTRYGVYRASDGSLQLGFREWNDSTRRFAAPQPVAGPLVNRSGNRRSGFRYFDEAGGELLPTNGAIDVSRVARIRVTMHSRVSVRERAQDSVRSDSVDVALRRAPSP